MIKIEITDDNKQTAQIKLPALESFVTDSTAELKIKLSREYAAGEFDAKGTDCDYVAMIVVAALTEVISKF